MGESIVSQRALACTIMMSAGLTFQSSGLVAQEEGSSRYALEEMIISSRRIEEGLQNAPIAVTAISGLELENRGALDVIDFAKAAPNVSMETNGTISGFGAAPRTSIRGIGQSDFVINTDPAVGLYADNVYLGRSIGSVLDLLDVERVEALRGPQGTLFGRNSTGGAINIISAKPDLDESFGNVTVGFGEEGYKLVRGLFNAPLSDTAAIRVSAFMREREGYIPALQYDDLALGAEDVHGVRGSLRFQPNEQLTIDVDADFSDRSDAPAPMVLARIGDLSVGETDLDLVAGPRQAGESTSIMGRVFNREPAGPQAPGTFAQWLSTDPLCGTEGQAYRDATPACLGNYWAGSRDGTNATWWTTDGVQTEPDQSLKTDGYALRVNWDGESVSFKSITALRGFESRFINSSPAPIMVSGNHNVKFDVDQLSQEFQLSGSTSGGGFDWLLGAFYMEEDGNETVIVVSPYPPPSFNNDLEYLPIGNTQDRFIDNESKAVFGQGIFHINDNLHLTLGARSTEESKYGRFELYDDNAVDFRTLEATANVKESNVLANLSWELSDQTMVYAQYSDGFRNGGFPSRQGGGTTVLTNYDPEYVDSYEAGLKTTVLDDRLRMNVAIFSMDYTEMQISAGILNPETGATPLSTDNLGESTIQGIEIESNFVATDNLRFDASIGYLEASLDSLAGDGLILNDGSNLRKIVDTSNELPFTPEWQVNLGVNHSAYFGGSELRTRVDWFYEADQWGGIGNYNAEKIPSTSKINFSTTYMPGDGNWEATLGARNLTDEEDISNATPLQGLQQGHFQVLQRGREAYLQFKYSFGE